MSRRIALASAALALFVAPTAAAAGDPVMPLSQVRPGMLCTGKTVVRGTTIANFNVDVVDVIVGLTGEPGPRILVRVSGPAVEPHGIAAGFSGAPVYCAGADGVPRVAGAIAETVGEFGNKVGLATPIEEMLGESPDPPASARSRPGLLRAARPVATPLTVAGLSGGTLTALRRAAGRIGRRVVAAPPGPLGSFAVQPLVPGASVALGISSGDLPVSGIGTVSYRDGATVWAFGHELDGAGRRSLLLQDAYVFTVVNQPLGTEEASSFKLAAAGHDLGTVTNDAFGAVVGRLGAPPRTVPLLVSVRDGDTGRTYFSQNRLADETDLDLGTGLGLVGTLALGQGQATVLRSSPPRMTSSICVRVRIQQRRRRLGFCGTFFDGESATQAFGTAAGLIDGFDRGPYRILSASAHLRVRRGVRDAFLRRGAVSPRRVRPGGLLRVRLVARGRRGGTQRYSFRVRVPRSLRPGRRVLTVRGSASSGGGGLEQQLLELLTGEGDGEGDDDELPPPRSVDELTERVAALRAVNGLRGGFFGRRSRALLLRSDAVRFNGSVRIPVRVVGRRARRR